MFKSVLAPLAGVAALAVPGAALAGTSSISGTFTSLDCGREHPVSVSERSRIQLGLRLSDPDTAFVVELRGPYGDVTRSDGSPSSGGFWQRDVFAAGSYSLRVCPKQRAEDDPPVSYTGTLTTGPTNAVPQQSAAPRTIRAAHDTRATVARVVSGSGVVAANGSVATFRVRTVNGVVKLTYLDKRAGIRIRESARVKLAWGLNSVTIRAGKVRVMLIDRGHKQDRVVATAAGYRVAGNVARGALTVL